MVQLTYGTEKRPQVVSGVTKMLTALQIQLFELADEEYKEFHSKLMPTVNAEKIIGIRVPVLRQFAADFSKTHEADLFISNLPHRYYEENNLHAFIIETKNDFDTCIKLVDDFLPYIDNWATCDMLSPKVFSKNKEELLTYISKWIKSEHTYTIRYGIGMLMAHYLDSGFSMDFPIAISKIKSEDYYVKMMVAWYFATALAKRYEEILPFFTNQVLDKWTHNKAIQKATESHRITAEHKTQLKSLKIQTMTKTHRDGTMCCDK